MNVSTHMVGLKSCAHGANEACRRAVSPGRELDIVDLYTGLGGPKVIPVVFERGRGRGEWSGGVTGDREKRDGEKVLSTGREEVRGRRWEGGNG